MTEQAYTGKKFALQATTPLGDDMLIATALEGAEHLSLPFLFTLSFWTGHDDLDPSQLVGEGVTAKLIDDEGNERLIHGLVTRLTIAGTHWLAEIRPWLWMLSLAIDSKIFQQKTAVEIIKAVCQDAGYSDLKDSLTGTYAARDYCVQYQETSLDFLHRLMEEEGIWYFFEHAEGKHTLVLADDASALTDCPQAASLPYQPLSESRAWLSNKRIESATLELSVAPGKVQADDFNFETPATDLKVAAAGKTGSLQVYDYPGLYAKKDAGEAAIKRRLQELQAAIKLLHGGGPVRHFAPGTKFTLTGHPAASLNA
ncbi:MAG: type VI secretion system tip protein VgrG, partial [Rhodospirillales bacterium]|nr:type VI secretion system tip protein VgrG [Rhodospirillales bacterium]